MNLIESIVAHEGVVRSGKLHIAYRDHKEKLTIGHGCLLDDRLEISDEVAELLLVAEIAEKAGRLRNVRGWEEAGPVRKDVLLEMAFWLGVGGCLRFVKMWNAVRHSDWPRAAAEMRDSRVWRDPKTRGRMNTLANRMETGTW